MYIYITITAGCEFTFAQPAVTIVYVTDGCKDKKISVQDGKIRNEDI